MVTTPDSEAVTNSGDRLADFVDTLLNDEEARINGLICFAPDSLIAADLRRLVFAEKMCKLREDEWAFGVIEFHSNNKLRERFYTVINDLRDAGCIVDLYLNDIQKVLAEFGYTMRIHKPAREEK